MQWATSDPNETKEKNMFSYLILFYGLVFTTMNDNNNNNFKRETRDTTVMEGGRG